MISRFVVRPDSERFRVLDIWTGQAALIAGLAQVELSQADAEHLAAMLNVQAGDDQATSAPTAS